MFVEPIYEGGHFLLEPHNITNEILAEKFKLLDAKIVQYEHFQANVDFFYLAICGCIISLMQIGFGLLEAGSINSKNATNVMFKNMMDSLICATVWWLVGYTLAFGEGSSFAGIYYYQGGRGLAEKLQYPHWFFQISYASTPATIMSGAVVDRISFIAYVLYSAVVSGVVYPIVCHWAWHPDGWLVQLGFKDFCGSGVVHLTGGVCAIWAAVILGARINRFPKPGTELTEQEKQRFTYHNAPLAGLGIMILYTGFFAFNGVSTLHITKPGDGQMFSKIMINTWLASSGGGLGCLLIYRTGIMDGNPRWSFMSAMNAGLSGMAATCAHADQLDVWWSFFNGLCVSVVYCCVVKVVERLKIDDPVNVIGVHFGGGLWGLVATSLLRSDSLVGGYGKAAGYFLAYNILGAIAIAAWSTAWVCAMFGTLKFFGLLRVSPEDELKGADITKHKEVAYIGIMCNCELLHKKTDGDHQLGEVALSRGNVMEMLALQLHKQNNQQAVVGGVNNPALDMAHEELEDIASRRHYASVAL